MSYKVISGISNMFAVAIFRTLLLLILFFLFTSGQAFSQTGYLGAFYNQAVLYAEVKEDKNSKKETEKNDCTYSRNQIDAFKGTIVKVLEREKIISQTHEELKQVFTDEDYITMDGYLSNLNNSYALFMKITIRTNNPYSAYGSLFKDDKLIFKLKNGETVTLHSGQSDSGNVDYQNDKTTYMTFFLLNDASIELLQSEEVNMARLYWSKGYEDYDIINPDFFIRQIGCVK